MLRAFRFLGLLTVHTGIAIVGTMIVEHAIWRVIPAHSVVRDVEGMHLERCLCNFDRVWHVANMAECGCKVGVGSCRGVVRIWVYHSAWRRLGRSIPLWECS